ncbi:hypothetical protein GX441_11810 [bacterium]|nr:hypothetical protein [bacterium]
MKKILFVLVFVVLMLGYVWMRFTNNNLAEKVTDLERRSGILEERLEREQIALSRELLVTNLEPRARTLGLYYAWEADGPR